MVILLLDAMFSSDNTQMRKVHLKRKDKYELHDDVVVCFCFPTLGVAVPLHPGDFLLFNALIPHCISSQCKQSDDIYCVSMYLNSLSAMDGHDRPLKN
jgi:hypothetical protein